MPPRRGVPAALRISAPPPPAASHIALLVPDDEPASPTTLDSAVSADSADYPPLPSARSTASRSSSMRNAKKLTINIPSAPSSAGSLASAGPHSAAPAQPQQQQQQQPQADGNHRPPAERLRRQSVVSLPGTTSLNSSLLHRKEEDGGAEDVPYSNGPVQIIPGIWIGSEENARDWKGLVERGIKAILNVAKEVYSPFDGVSKTLRNVSSTPNFRSTTTLSSSSEDTTLYPAHLPSGRPAMHYLKLQWSHGQQDLVNNGFQSAMSFVDAALSRNEGVLVHCQCGISRSATMVIALVMRAAQSKSPLVPPEVWDLKGMQGAYSFVKEKSPIVGPNMSLIYQLLDYEKTLRGDTGSDSEDSGKEDEEWIRKRRELDEASSSEDGDEEEDLQRSVIMQEARALDKAMEDRIIARKSSTSSINSTGSGIGMGTAWRSQYRARKRTGSIASSRTSNSVLSEDLLEEEEEEELLGIGGGFDSGRERHSSLESNGAEESSPDDEVEDSRFYAPLTAKATSHPVPEPLPSAPVWKTSFSIPPPPLTAVRSTFNIPPPTLKSRKKRPMSLSVLPPVPPSPIVIEQDEPAPAPAPAPIAAPLPPASKPLTLAARRRTESGKPIPPPLALRNSVLRRASSSAVDTTSSALPTPSQTLFLFPPSPTMNTRTPSTMTLTTEVAGPVPFPALSTPKVSTFRQKGGRTKSFIGLRSPPTPTIGFSKVDARGFFGMQ